jgi:serine/threonine-protein kinase
MVEGSAPSTSLAAALPVIEKLSNPLLSDPLPSEAMGEAGAPAHIGRYEIVGRLAAGGMAEVFLARLKGPHGFETPVVIKRILPHLALDQNVIEMFLDEARIIANLRHPNLIHVHELGRDGGDLFIAMEFLSGETLSGLCRRLASRKELLDPTLAAHIIAEACAGLHAAHEATSNDGRPLEIVHRDVSPQNIFVTYAGEIHVIDFGIATTADRVSRTEAGTVRGKFEYLAPEQLQSIPLDRRADIFALGVVLLELSSGRRVYKRASHAETLLAIVAQDVPKLTALRPDAPEALEAICSRALQKSRRERYQTAADMRRELLSFMRQRLDDDPGQQLSRLMHDLFADRVSEKNEMMRRVGQGSELETLPAAEVDIHVELPSAVEVETSATTMLSQSLQLDLAPTNARRRRLVLPVIALGVLFAGTGALAFKRTSHVGTPGAAATAIVTASAEPGPPAPAAVAEAPAAPGSSPPPGPPPVPDPAATQALPSIPYKARTKSPRVAPAPRPPQKPSPTIW